MILKNSIHDFVWDDYKNLEYYPDRVCACGCEGLIKVRASHKENGIPQYILNHEKISDFSLYSRVNRILSGLEEAPLCECGCGERISIKEWHRAAGIPEFIHGHNGKGDLNPWKGHKHTEEAIEKNRQKHTGVNNANFGKRGLGVTFSGGHHTEDAKKCIGDAQRGEKNCNWCGGISQDEYPCVFNNKLRNCIRERDGNTCQLCGRTREENYRELDVHHIDYIKENCKQENLITLCAACNSRVNGNRSCWTLFFQDKIRSICGVAV